MTGEFVNSVPEKINKKPHYSTAYSRLVATLDRLTRIVKNSSGFTNKELAKMTDTLNNICNKWEE